MILEFRPSVPVLTKADRYDFLARLHADPRFTNGHGDLCTREYIEAFTWREWATDDGTWQEPRGGFRSFRMIAYGDRPRWEPPKRDTCEAILMGGKRKGQECGKPKWTMFPVTDRETGEWRRSCWCRAHEAEGRKVQRRELAMGPWPDDLPTPPPNRGGLLPCHLHIVKPGETWEGVYRRHSGAAWEPPREGCCADDWRHLDVAPPEPTRPVLRLLTGGITVDETG